MTPGNAPDRTATDSDAEVRRCNRFFWLLAVSNALVWALAGSLVIPNPPLDVVELLACGRSWQLGYAKHPPLPAWLAEFGYQAVAGQVWGVHLVSQACMIIAMYNARRDSICSTNSDATGAICVSSRFFAARRREAGFSLTAKPPTPTPLSKVHLASVSSGSPRG